MNVIGCYLPQSEAKMKENKRCIIFHKKCYGIHGKIYTIIPQSEEKRRKIKVASYRFPLKKLKENVMEFMERSVYTIIGTLV